MNVIGKKIRSHDMKKLAALLIFAFCFVASKPSYSKPIVRCNPANGAVRIDLAKGKNLPGDLETLGARLMLPEGWTYQARRLDADLELKADGLAYVINDDFYNSYQWREK
jgi:hypothetical protein